MIDVERPAEAPASLAHGRYDATDVLEALHATFLGKCYPAVAGRLDPTESMHLVKVSVSRRAPYAMLMRSYFGGIAEVRALFD